MGSLKLIGLAVLVLLLLAVTKESALCNGRELRETEYQGQIKMAQGEVLFSTRIEKVMFSLNSLQDKYKVVRIQVENRSNIAISLSIEKDKMELLFMDGRIISGILDLSSHDPNLWQSFSPEFRAILAYPEIVQKETRSIQNIFIFIPNPKLDELPKSFRYTIDSLEKRRIDIIDVTPKPKK